MRSFLATETDPHWTYSVVREGVKVARNGMWEFILELSQCIDREKLCSN